MRLMLAIDLIPLLGPLALVLERKYGAC